MSFSPKNISKIIRRQIEPDYKKTQSVQQPEFDQGISLGAIRQIDPIYGKQQPQQQENFKNGLVAAVIRQLDPMYEKNPQPIQQPMMPVQLDPYGQQQTGLAQALMKGIGYART